MDFIKQVGEKEMTGAIESMTSDLLEKLHVANIVVNMAPYKKNTPHLQISGSKC